MEEYEIVVKSLMGTREIQQDCANAIVNGTEAFAVVCDGMGGHNGGEIASHLAVEELSKRYRQGGCNDPPRFFINNIEAVNQAVYQLRTPDGKLLKGGTTLVSVIVRDYELYWISVGDSRLYIYRGRELLQLSEDHNYFLVLEEKLKKGEITEEEFLSSSEKGNALISCIGMKKLGRVNLNLSPYKLMPSDMVILTTDGLYKALGDEGIEESVLVTAELTAEEFCQRIEELKGFDIDNTTFVLIKIH